MPGDTNTTCQHVMLVVPDSRYSQHIPALIGTNILDNLMYHVSVDISLCSAKSVDCIIEGVDLYGISLSKYPSASIELFGKMVIELTKNNDRLAVIRTCNRITILPNKSIVVEGYLDNEIPYKCWYLLMLVYVGCIYCLVQQALHADR
jgi:hypothetical protein